MCDVQIVGKGELCDPFEALLQVRLNACWVFCFRQDLKHLVVAKEKEPGKVKSLLLEIVVKTLDNNFEVCV